MTVFVIKAKVESGRYNPASEALRLLEEHDSARAADRWVVKLFDAVERPGRTPGMDYRREDLTEFPGWRM